jgi:hypothetical protein
MIVGAEGKVRAGCLLLLPIFRLFFDREDGGDIFLRNVRLSPNYTAYNRPTKIVTSIF